MLCGVGALSARSAIAAGCHARPAAKDGCQMALVGEPGLLRDQGQRLIAPPHQGFCPFEPALHDVTLRPRPGRFLERAAEVIRAETGDFGEDGEREVVLEMLLDVV